MAGITGLRETVSLLGNHGAELYRLGATPVKLSTLPGANPLRPNAV